MKKWLYISILSLICISFVACGNNQSQRTNESQPFYPNSYKAEEHYYTDPSSGLKYSKTSFSNPQYQTSSSSKGANSNYQSGYQEGYEDALSGDRNASYRSSNKSYQAGYEEGYEDAKNGIEAGY